MEHFTRFTAKYCPKTSQEQQEDIFTDNIWYLKYYLQTEQALNLLNCAINRGYYMAGGRYDISLRLLKNISWVRAANEWNIFSTREEKFRISKHNINTNEIQNHFTLIVFWCERRDLLWSHSNGDIFTCEDIKFSCESSPGISLVFI